jgi:hypothetical protein
MFATMQQDVKSAINSGIIPKNTLAAALNDGLVGKEFIDDVVKALA